MYMYIIDMSDTKCISYQPKLYEFLLPSTILLKKLCLSYDKTELFIVSLIRLLIYIILLNLIKKHDYIQKILYVIILLNLIYLFVIIIKTPILSVNTDKSIMSVGQL